MKSLHVLTAVLVIIGALNWGLVGIARLDLVHALFGASILSTIVYVLVGVSGVFQALYLTGALAMRHPARA